MRIMKYGNVGIGYTAKYICEICKSEYASQRDALKCEAMPANSGWNVSIGDLIRITSTPINANDRIYPLKHPLIGIVMDLKLTSMNIQEWNNSKWVWHEPRIEALILNWEGHNEPEYSKIYPMSSYEPFYLNECAFPSMLDALTKAIHIFHTNEARR